MVVSDVCLINASGENIADSMWMHQGLRVTNGKPFKQLVYSNFATGCAMMIRRRLLDIALPFPVDCMVHDWWLGVVCCSRVGGGLVLLDRPLTRYRQHGSNVIGAHSGSLQTSILQVTALEARMQWYRLNLLRLNGYLQREGWDEEDISAIKLAQEAFTCLCATHQASIWGRLGTVCKSLRVASEESFRHRLGLVLFSLYPMLVDHLRWRAKKNKLAGEICELFMPEA